MKRNLKVISLLIALSATILSACTFDKLNFHSYDNGNYDKSSIIPGSSYNIFYTSKVYELLLDKVPSEEKPGNKVALKTSILYDVNLDLFALNYYNKDNTIEFYLDFEASDDSWIFSFTMPGYPTIIDCCITGGM